MNWSHVDPEVEYDFFPKVYFEVGYHFPLSCCPRILLAIYTCVWLVEFLVPSNNYQMSTYYCLN